MQLDIKDGENIKKKIIGVCVVVFHTQCWHLIEAQIQILAAALPFPVQVPRPLNPCGKPRRANQNFIFYHHLIAGKIYIQNTRTTKKVHIETKRNAYFR